MLCRLECGLSAREAREGENLKGRSVDGKGSRTTKFAVEEKGGKNVVACSKDEIVWLSNAYARLV